MAKRLVVANEQKSPGEVLRHPLRTRILIACTERPTAIREFAEQAGVKLPKARYHFHKLERHGYIRIARKEPVRGAYKHLFVATRLGVITDAEFGALKAEEQRRLSTALVTTFHGRCLTALRAGTFDSRVDSHFSWVPRTLDEQGWKEQMEELLRGYERSNEIEAESKARLRRGGGGEIHTTLGQAGFESPPDRSQGDRP
jgi:predicted ArsR family transcriptional regulator